VLTNENLRGIQNSDQLLRWQNEKVEEKKFLGRDFTVSKHILRKKIRKESKYLLSLDPTNWN
jgi:hypothetical protein